MNKRTTLGITTLVVSDPVGVRRKIALGLLFIAMGALVLSGFEMQLSVISY